jgi:hypothetical protein
MTPTLGQIGLHGMGSLSSAMLSLLSNCSEDLGTERT